MIKTVPITINEKVKSYPGKGGWYFVTVQSEDGEELSMQYIWPRRGFGAIPVNVTIGQSQWKTSIFPEKTGYYFLPIKKEIRLKQNIKEGDKLKITLEVINSS